MMPWPWTTDYEAGAEDLGQSFIHVILRRDLGPLLPHPDHIELVDSQRLLMREDLIDQFVDNNWHPPVPYGAVSKARGLDETEESVPDCDDYDVLCHGQLTGASIRLKLRRIPALGSIRIRWKNATVDHRLNLFIGYRPKEIPRLRLLEPQAKRGGKRWYTPEEFKQGLEAVRRIRI